MNLYLIDTDITSYFLRGKNNLENIFRQKGLDKIRFSVVTIGELKVLAYKNPASIINLDKINQLCEQFGILDIDSAVWEKYSQLKAELLRKGKFTGDFDILNTSIALTHNCIVVTNNVAHYSDLVAVDNWIN